MFYEDLFDIEEEQEDRYKKYASRFSSIFDLKKEKKFYKLYSVFTECHLVLVKNKVFDKKLYDIKRMKPQERILELSNSNELHIFNIDNLMNSEFKNNSIIITNTKNEKG